MSQPKSIVLLHGALGSKDQFTNLSQRLSARFQVYHFNFAGHGGSSITEGFSIQLFTEQLIMFLNSKKLTQVIIFGYSMGGYVALHAASKDNRICRIITYGTKFNWTSETATIEAKSLNPKKIVEKVPNFADLLNKRHSPTDWKQVVNQTAKLMLALGESPILGESTIALIKIPVSILVGTEDSMVSIEESKKIADLLSYGELKVLDGWKHAWEQLNEDKLFKLLSNYV